jgi:putative spermidine/putrescine transport system substrate-binding protein
MKRRSLLISSGGLALAALLGGCRRRDNALRVLFLEDSVPPQLLKAFRSALTQPLPLNFVPRPQIAGIFEQLENWQTAESPRGADLVTLGDAWLVEAIQQNLIQPLEVSSVAGWARVPKPWQDLVTRDRQGSLSPTGQVWGAPYRWGSVAIAFRKDKLEPLGWQPQDWADLWRPELAGMLSLPDSPRTVLGLVLKKLGRSVNEADLDSVPDFGAELAALDRQTKFYSSTAYLQPLLIDDTWAAVGWTTDILPLMQGDPRIGAVIPASGTVLFSDLWVRPARSPSADAQSAPTLESAIAQWIDFCWQSEAATRLSLQTAAASPIFALDAAELPTEPQNRDLLLPPTAILEKSEFLLPLSPASAAQFRQAWAALPRQASGGPSAQRFPQSAA